MENPAAVVTRTSAGGLVLHDPVGAAVVRAVARHNCRAVMAENLDRVAHFVGRVGELARSWDDTVAALMPNAGPMWDDMRRLGLAPVARGLAERAGVLEFLGAVDPDGARALAATPGPAVVVVAHGVATVFTPGGIMVDHCLAGEV
jgi:hypothetical protein